MSFLKKHWQFTVPVAVVLCVLLVGAIVLHSTSETPEPNRVYVMPERRSDNPPPVNTDGIPSQPLMASKENVGPKEHRMETTTPVTTLTSTPSIGEDVESCCPDESVVFDQSVSDDSISTMIYVPNEDAKRSREYFLIWKEWSGKERDLLLERHNHILEADKSIRSLGEFKTYQDVIDRFASMTSEEAAAREQFWKSWDIREEELVRREEELVSTSTTKEKAIQ